MQNYWNVSHIFKLLSLKWKLWKLFIHLIIQAFAISLIAIFVPVYLLTIGFSLSQVFLYLLVEWTFFWLFAPIYWKIISKVWLREILLFRTPVYITWLVWLFFLENNPILKEFYLIIPAIIWISSSLYTLSITTLFAKYMWKNNHGAKTAKLISYPHICSIAGPTIWAFIASMFGFNVLLILVAVLLFLSVIPIYLIKKKIELPKFDFKVLSKIKLDKKEFILLNSYWAKTLIFSLVLPITLYLYFKDIISLWIIVTIISLLSALFTIYLGKINDKFTKFPLIKIWAILTFFILFSMAFFIKSEILFYLSIISGFINVLINLPYETYLYKKSREHNNPLEFLVFKEFSLFFGRVILFVILTVFFSNIEVAYYFAAIVSLVFLFL